MQAVCELALLSQLASIKTLAREPSPTEGTVRLPQARKTTMWRHAWLLRLSARKVAMNGMMRTMSSPH